MAAGEESALVPRRLVEIPHAPRKLILIYTGDRLAGMQFDTESVQRQNVWGSELSAVNLALALARTGKYLPILCCPIPPDRSNELGESLYPCFEHLGVINLDNSQINTALMELPIHATIISRFLHYLMTYPTKGRVILWVHDLAMHYSYVHTPEPTPALPSPPLSVMKLPNMGKALWSNTQHLFHRVIAVSGWQREQLRAGYEFRADQLGCIYNGLEQYPEELELGAKVVDLPRRAFSFLYASDPSRGLKLCLDAFEQLQEEFGEASLDICWSKLPDDLQARVDANPKIKFRGKLTNRNLRKLMRFTEFYLYPHQIHETFGLVALEAMASGCIPICRQWSGIGEIVHGKGLTIPVAGYVHSESDQKIVVDLMVKQLRPIMTSPEFKTALRKQGWAWASQQSWDARMEEWSGVLD